ncbi:polysaccharide lyase 8 family protein [Clostridium sp. CTA-7]
MKKSKESTKRLIALSLAGSVIITTALGTTVNAVTNQVNTSSIVVNANGDIDKLIESLRLKWKEDLTGGASIDVTNPTIAKKIEGYAKQAKTYSESMNLDETKNYLWADLQDYKANPARITSMFNNIVSMTMAYSLPNNTYYKNEDLKNKIIYALEWINKNAYNESIEQYGNWWDWMIGIPARLNNVVILMYDDLTQEQVTKYMNAIQKFLPSIEPGSKYHTGANLADVCVNKLLQGVNLKDPDKIKEASEDIGDVFKYVTSGDGFYPDGSYVQHGIVAYTGSYGNVLIDKISNIMFLLEGTPWELSSDYKNNAYNWIFESFDPVIYKGYVMDMVRGRSISRFDGNGYMQAAGIIEGMLKISLISDEATASKIQALVKQWSTEASSVIDFGTKFKSINVTNKFYAIMKDQTISTAEQGDAHYALNMMDKTIHERQDYGLAIARSSNRISKYEFMNKENLKPWFQGDGMLYLHNSDLTQFSDDFWPTIDPYRMPGTTIDKRLRSDKDILPGVDPGSPLQDEVYYELGNSNWSGGTKLGVYGAAGMQIDNKYDSLKANKSWFMFDNEIVALGSGITNPEDFSTETIIENRKIRKDGSNKFIVDGAEKVRALGDKDSANEAKWAYLEGNVEGANIGYYFPNGANINLLRENREGNWFDINASKPAGNKIITNNYLTMYIDHGKNIKDQSYSYVLLPNKSSQQVAEYANNPNIEIVRNDEIAHGVKHTTLNMEGANFWVDGKNTSGSITSLGKASVMIKKNVDNTLTISVSDPTFQGQNISIEVAKSATKLVKADDQISNVNLKDGKIAFDVNTSNAMGASFELVVELGNAEVTNEAPVINGEDIKLYVGDKWDKDLHKLVASDKEDGDLTNNINIKSNNIKLDSNSVVTEKGEYSVVFEVSDSKGVKTEKEFKVVVEEKATTSNDKNSNDKESISKDKLPNTGAVVGGTALAGIGGALSLLGLKMFRRKKN